MSAHQPAWGDPTSIGLGHGHGHGHGHGMAQFDPQLDMNWVFGGDQQAVTGEGLMHGQGTGMMGAYPPQPSSMGGAFGASHQQQSNTNGYSNGVVGHLPYQAQSQSQSQAYGYGVSGDQHASTSSAPNHDQGAIAAASSYNLSALQALYQTGDLTRSAYESLTGMTAPPYPPQPSSSDYQYPPTSSSASTSASASTARGPAIPSSLAPPLSNHQPISNRPSPNSFYPSNQPPSFQPSPSPYPPPPTSSSTTRPSQRRHPSSTSSSTLTSTAISADPNANIATGSIQPHILQAQLDGISQAKEVEMRLDQLRGILATRSQNNLPQETLQRLERDSEMLKSQHHQLVSRHDEFIAQNGGQDRVQREMHAYLSRNQYGPGPGSSNSNSNPYPTPPSTTLHLNYNSNNNPNSLYPPSTQQQGQQSTTTRGKTGESPPEHGATPLPPGLQASVLARQRAAAAASASTQDQASPPTPASSSSSSNKPPGNTGASASTATATTITGKTKVPAGAVRPRKGASPTSSSASTSTSAQNQPLGLASGGGPSANGTAAGKRQVAPLPNRKHRQLVRENATTILAKGMEGMPTLTELQHQLRPDQFYSSLHRVAEKRGIELRESYVVEGRQIPLFEFYQAVMVEGHGREQVEADQAWATIAKHIDLPTTPSFLRGLTQVYHDALSVYETVWSDALLRQRNRLADIRRAGAEGDGSASDSSRGSGNAPTRPPGSLPTMLKFSEAPPGRPAGGAAAASAMPSLPRTHPAGPSSSATSVRQPFFDPLSQDPSLSAASSLALPNGLFSSTQGGQFTAAAPGGDPAMDMAFFFNLPGTQVDQQMNRFEELDSDEPVQKHRRTETGTATSSSPSAMNVPAPSDGSEIQIGRGNKRQYDATYQPAPTPSFAYAAYPPADDMSMDHTHQWTGGSTDPDATLLSTPYRDGSDVLRSLGLQASPEATPPELMGGGLAGGSDGSSPSNGGIIADAAFFDSQSLLTQNFGSWEPPDQARGDESWAKFDFDVGDVSSQWGV